ncbi:rRNA maturation RNase YbeY [Gemmobacter sp.]|uniref:rRNA maturation RNase YbeY n=1 Tax=Gemmobacter sp. TaxID=1898957 RepID=UPI002AFF7CDC|nr:rRNA maturation RNase YbeY [Gemmobacter sp.]
MENLVDIVIEEPRWETAGLDAMSERAAQAVLAELGLPATGFVICVMGCDDARIADLNADFRGKPKPTNVLSWPSEERAPEMAGEAPDLPEPGDSDDPEELGDIAIAWGVCQAEAAEQRKPFADHVTHLVAHGVLHLLGYDHETEEDAALMEGIEIRALARLGISNPY